mmetsp:Transcript_10781/g.18878  ORF Transcript_10781/g.18878 Transcript_10781/m.18878 type:complete len:361 (-) Transcript_10781:625-1707(-)
MLDISRPPHLWPAATLLRDIRLHMRLPLPSLPQPPWAPPRVPLKHTLLSLLHHTPPKRIAPRLRLHTRLPLPLRKPTAPSSTPQPLRLDISPHMRLELLSLLPPTWAPPRVPRKHTLSSLRHHTRLKHMPRRLRLHIRLRRLPRPPWPPPAVRAKYMLPLHLSLRRRVLHSWLPQRPSWAQPSAQLMFTPLRRPPPPLLLLIRRRQPERRKHTGLRRPPDTRRRLPLRRRPTRPRRLPLLRKPTRPRRPQAIRLKDTHRPHRPATLRRPATPLSSTLLSPRSQSATPSCRYSQRCKRSRTSRSWGTRPRTRRQCRPCTHRCPSRRCTQPRCLHGHTTAMEAATIITSTPAAGRNPSCRPH